MKIINIPLNLPFLDIIAQQLLEETKNSFEALANFTIIVPNFKSVVAIQEAFLRVSAGQPLILPKIISLHNLEFLISRASLQHPQIKSSLESSNFFKPTISKFARNYILSNFIKLKDNKISTIQALHLAASLGETLDNAYIQDVNFSNIKNIVITNLANHWQDNLIFLDIITSTWPAFLKEKNYLDVEQRKKTILNLQSLIWQKLPSNNNLIFVNIVSFFKPTLNLLKSGLETENSRAYFYGIDKTATSSNINYSHPQKIITTTLEYLGIKSENIIQNEKISFQEEFIHSLFNLEITKNLNPKIVRENINNISIITTTSEDEEAKTIALAIREKLEQPAERITVVCNNKILVQRIIQELKRWNIDANDHLGEPLKETLPYKIFLATLEFISEDFNIQNLYTILKHPLVNFGIPKQKYKLIVDTLDTHVFRNLNLNVYKENYYQEAIEYINDSPYINKQIKPSLTKFLQKIEETFKKINKIKTNLIIDPLELITEHIQLVEKITLKKNGHNVVWQNQEGKALSNKLLNLMEECQYLPNITLEEYASLFVLYFYQETIIQRYNKHHRINIYSGLTSTITNTPTVIIAAANENMLPYLSKPNPWLNKYIQENLEFLNEESQIGSQAHTFMQLLGNREIIFTRSTKEGKDATKPSRWLYKIATLLDLYKVDYNKYNYLKDLALYLSENETSNSIQRPTIAVPKKLFPDNIPATDIDKLYQNSYIFFIKKILNYKILNPIGINKNNINALYGTYMHTTIENIVNHIHKHKTVDYTYVNKQINENFYPLLKNDYVFKTFQYSAIKTSLENFLNLDIPNILVSEKILTETSSEYYLQLTDNWQIKITAKMDRIDILNNNILITDYKTSSGGTKPYMKQLQTASLILYHNKVFNLVDNIENISARFLVLGKSSSNPFVEEVVDKTINQTNKNLAEVIEEIKTNLISTITSKITNNNIVFTFENTATKDIAAPYLHFARFEEWNTNISMEEPDNNSENTNFNLEENE